MIDKGFCLSIIWINHIDQYVKLKLEKKILKRLYSLQIRKSYQNYELTWNKDLRLGLLLEEICKVIISQVIILD